jgi:hypothetical protein
MLIHLILKMHSQISTPLVRRIECFSHDLYIAPIFQGMETINFNDTSKANWGSFSKGILNRYAPKLDVRVREYRDL